MNRDLNLDAFIAAVLVYFKSDDTAREFYEAMVAPLAQSMEQEILLASELLKVEANANDILAKHLNRLPGRVRDINTTTANILISAAEKASSVEDLARDAKRIFGLFQSTRALLISRTEILGATNFAALEMFLLAGVPFKRWIGTMDDRIRDSHEATNDQVQSVHDPFRVGGDYLQFPGDPNGSAKEVVNCRCWMLPEWSPERSIWTYEYIRSAWGRYLARTTKFENDLAEIVRGVFDVHLNKVLSFL